MSVCATYMYFEVFETTGDMIWPSFYKQKDKKNIVLKKQAQGERHYFK